MTEDCRSDVYVVYVGTTFKIMKDNNAVSFTNLVI
jgi:hypothetical protein